MKQFRSQGTDIYWGNASQREFLVRCGIAKARALIVTIGAVEGSEDIVAAARHLNKDLTIVARARDASHARELYELGVNRRGARDGRGELAIVGGRSGRHGVFRWGS